MKQEQVLHRSIYLYSTQQKRWKANSINTEMLQFLAVICFLVQITEQTKTACIVQCPPLPGCAERCLFGHEKDAQGCDICNRCKKEGIIHGDIEINEANYDQYISTFHPNCKVSTRGSLPRGINEWPKQGNEVRIGYIFDETVSLSKQANIRTAITEYDQNTCIRFVPRTQETDYIRFVGTGGCSSFIGHIGNEQNVTLGPGCDVFLGTIIHELMHALGFWHEHSRGDRDDYVIIQLENVLEGKYWTLNRIHDGCFSEISTIHKYAILFNRPSWKFRKANNILGFPQFSV
ncbi:unnamed protein product [Clavelina lepadiformis]|uniref:Metalloendopeptidase n=1 Tax=Clavelina lepadiformis TaxID=159417 RepID=A0ABP0GGS7_CLALP